MMHPGMRCIVLLALSLGPAAGAAQSTLERTPNLSAGWTGSGNRLDFHFVHRFNHSGAPQRQVQNRATLVAAWELPWNAVVGAAWASRSALAAGVPNEWEPFVRFAPLADESGLRVAAQLGYNNAARSVDGEVTGTRRFGRIRPVLAVRILGSDAETRDTRVGAGAGAVLRLLPDIAVAADAGRLFGDGDTDLVWGAGVQVRIPHSPHSLSLHATNADALTIHSASRSGGRVRWGFEFTVPVTPARYLGGGNPAAPAAAPVSIPGQREAADTAVVVLRGLAFSPQRLTVRRGTVVRWSNQDEVIHTIRLADGSWDSGLLEPGHAWHRRFDTTGVYRIRCGPHPFMLFELTVVP